MTSTSARIKSAPVGGITLAWEEHGEGTRPLVLVHGFTGSRDDWSDVVGQLATRGRTVLFDQRGHGASSKLGPYTIERLVLDLEGFLEAVGIEQCDLLGHSLGGAVALRFTLAHPDRVASLILMDTGARAPEGLHDDLLVAAEAVRVNGMSWFADQVTAQPLTGEDAVIARRLGEQQHRSRTRAQLEAVDPAAFIAFASALGDHEPVTDRLAEISCPTTVVVGAEDEPFLVLSSELAESIPDAALVVLAGGGHSPQKSVSEAWVDAVSDHLHRVRR